MDSKSKQQTQESLMGAAQDEAPPPPQYSEENNPKVSNAATQSSWAGWSGAEGGNIFGFAPNTNTMDPSTMPSDQAAAARMKAAEVMAKLRSGEPGAADRAMGDREGKGATGLMPIPSWLRKKAKGVKKGEQGAKDENGGGQK